MAMLEEPKFARKISRSDNDNTINVTKQGGGKLRLDHDALLTVFMRPELQGKPIAIISITGPLRSGKSFLMNFILRYLRKKGWQNEDWIGNENFKIEKEDFRYEASDDRVTTGIRFYKESFAVIDRNGKEIMVLLMDTQGLFDHETNLAVNKYLVTLTTLMSSVQIFNVKGNIDAYQLCYLQTCVDFAIETAKSTNNKPQQKLWGFQNLMFLLRDFHEPYGLERGKKYLDNILNNTGGVDDLQKVRSGIKTSFTHVEGFALPFPGAIVLRSKFAGMLDELDQIFIENVKAFVEHIFSPDNLIPKRSTSNSDVTARELLNMCAACDSNLLTGECGVEELIMTNVETYYSSLCQELVKEYEASMGNIFDDPDISSLEQRHNEMKMFYKRRFNQDSGVEGAESYKKKYEDRFEDKCNERYKYLSDIFREKKNALKTSAKDRSKNAFAEYKKLMEPERVLKGEDIKAIHKESRDKALSKYKNIDMEYLDELVNKYFEDFERDVKQRKEEEEKARDQKSKELLILAKKLEAKCKKGWRKFALHYHDKITMDEKKQEMMSQIVDDYWENALSPVEKKFKNILKERTQKKICVQTAGDISETHCDADIFQEKESIETLGSFTQENENLSKLVEEIVDEVAQKIKSGEIKADQLDTFTYEEKFLNGCSEHYVPVYKKVVQMFDSKLKEAIEQNRQNWNLLEAGIEEAVRVAMYEREMAFVTIMRDRHISEETLEDYFVQLINHVRKNPPTEIAERVGKSEDARKFYEGNVKKAVEKMRNDVENQNKENRNYVCLTETIEVPKLEMVVTWIWSGFKDIFSAIFNMGGPPNKRIQEAIEKYENMMREKLSSPVTDAAFEKIHSSKQEYILEKYGDIADEEALKLGVTKRYESLKIEYILSSQNITKSTEEFYKNHLGDDSVYRFDPNRPKGIVLIINNNFDDKREKTLRREGSDVDVHNLNALWQALGFQVKIEENLSAAEMQSSCDKFARDAKNVSAIVVVMMSHGGSSEKEHYILGNDGKAVYLEKIFSFFTSQKCPDLAGIPKVFIFQACRGTESEIYQTDAEVSVDLRTKPRIPAKADMLKIYPSESGHVAYRHPHTGSVLMNAITKVFYRHAHKKDVLNMLTMVNNEVAGKEPRKNEVQMSNQNMFLTKTLYLFPGFPK